MMQARECGMFAGIFVGNKVNGIKSLLSSAICDYNVIKNKMKFIFIYCSVMRGSAAWAHVAVSE